MASSFAAGAPEYGSQGAGPAFGGSDVSGLAGSAAGYLGALSSVIQLAGGISSVFVGYRQARELQKQAEMEARRIRRAGDKILGAQAVAYAHAGVTQKGTPADVRNDTIAEIEQEVFYSTMRFENAANSIRSEGIQAGSQSGADAVTTLSLTALDASGETALLRRDRRYGLTTGIYGY